MPVEGEQARTEVARHGPAIGQICLIESQRGIGHETERENPRRSACSIEVEEKRTDDIVHLNLGPDRIQRFFLVDGQVKDQPLACRGIVKRDGPEYQLVSPDQVVRTDHDLQGGATGSRDRGFPSPSS